MLPLLAPKALALLKKLGAPLGRVAAIAGLMALAAALVLAVLSHHRQTVVAASQALAGNNQAVASAKAAQDTIHIVVDNQAAHGRIDVVTQGNINAIRNAPGAVAAVDPAVHRAGLRALCLYDAYRLQPACGELLKPDPGNPAG